LRVIFYEKYAIYYLPRPDEIIIVRVLHGSRDIAFITDEGGFDVWFSGREERHFMKKTCNATKKSPTAESIAGMADEGKDVYRFFTNSGQMVSPVQRINVDASGRANEWRSKLWLPAWEVDTTWVGSYEAIAAGE
jgi:hypothetical protein